jgi:hypothetical protein
MGDVGGQPGADDAGFDARDADVGQQFLPQGVWPAFRPHSMTA